MLRTAPRQVLRQTRLPLRPQRIGVRNQSTLPPAPKRRSFKNTLVRWGIAIGGVYWYNTSPIFNEPPSYVIQNTDSNSEEVLPTIASVAASSRFRPPHPEDAPVVPSTPSTNSPPSINPKSPDPRDPNAPTTVPDTSAPQDPSSLEQEAASQGAFNEETGEINWDCPCLGGMAYGPCGQEFRDAFSCFVYSDKEPKGIDCIENFEKMQTCFRAHPEIYASEIDDDERMERELNEEVGRGAVKENKDPLMPDVDQPSVWTPVSSTEEAPKAEVRKSAEAPAAPAAASKPKPQPNPRVDKKPVYDTPAHHASSADSPASSPSSPTDKVSDKARDVVTGVKETALAKGQEVREAFEADKTRNESEQAVPKAAHDAR